MQFHQEKIQEKINEYQIMKYESKISTLSIFYFYMNFDIH